MEGKKTRRNLRSICRLKNKSVVWNIVESPTIQAPTDANKCVSDCKLATKTGEGLITAGRAAHEPVVAEPV